MTGRIISMLDPVVPMKLDSSVPTSSKKTLIRGGSCQIAFKPDVAGDTVQSQQQNNEGEIVVDDTVRSSLQARGDAVLHRKQNDSQNSPESGNQWHVFLPDPGIQDREQRNR